MEVIPKAFYKIATRGIAPSSSTFDNKYITITMIDYGSFGDILKVRSPRDDKIYAMKQIAFRGQLRDDPYIVSEIMCLSELKHENVIRLHEILVKDGEIDIIMEYAENENLERYYTQVGIPSDEIIQDIYAQLLHGVNYCHSMNIAHRDLTPANILLTKDNVVKLADFGLAVRSLDEYGNQILCSDYLGNVGYLSPEVLSRQPFLPKPADIWSLGVVLLYLLYNDIPFKGYETRIIETQQNLNLNDFHNSNGNRMKHQPSSLSVVLERTLVVKWSDRADICELDRMWDQVDIQTGKFV